MILIQLTGDLERVDDCESHGVLRLLLGSGVVGVAGYDILVGVPCCTFSPLLGCRICYVRRHALVEDYRSSSDQGSNA